MLSYIAFFVPVPQGKWSFSSDTLMGFMSLSFVLIASPSWHQDGARVGMVMKWEEDVPGRGVVQRCGPTGVFGGRAGGRPSPGPS